MPRRNPDVRKFERASTQRLTAAGLLLQHQFHLEAMYLAGYAVECAMKALILRRTSQNKQESMLQRLTKVGSKGHDFEYLKAILRGPTISCQPPREIMEMLRRVVSWSTDLRYEVGAVEYDEAKGFVDAAQEVCAWCARS